MATSGSVDFNQTRNELIEDAFQLIGVYGVGRTVSAEDMNFASNSLNKMVKAWQAKGLHLWAKEEAYLFGAKNTAEYQLGNTSNDARASKRTDVVLTELSTDEAASSTVLGVDDSTDMSTGDIVGIELNDGTTHWDTIVSIDSSTQITVTTGLSGAASTNRNVYAFTSRINKPLRIHSMRRVTGIGDNQSSIPMIPLSQQEYFDLPNKNSNGAPTHFYYNPSLTNGRLYIWPRPQNTEYHYEMTFDRMLEDFDASSDVPDFPSEWLECITYQLAYRLAPAFNKDKNMLQPEASVMLEDMLNWDAETTNVTIQPDRGYN